LLFFLLIYKEVSNLLYISYTLEGKAYVFAVFRNKPHLLQGEQLHTKYVTYGDAEDSLENLLVHVSEFSGLDDIFAEPVAIRYPHDLSYSRFIIEDLLPVGIHIDDILILIVGRGRIGRDPESERGVALEGFSSL